MEEGLHELVERARALSGEEREAFLREHCPDVAMRRRVELELLGVEDVEPRTSTRIGDAVDAGTPGAGGPVPERIGRYEIVRPIGAGGMGVVYLARQQQPARQVALKLIRSDLVSEAVLRRFALEAEVLGLLHRGRLP